MKRILITGRNSYIGTSFETYLSQFPEAYQVETISVRGDGWQEVDFSSYDVLFHVAGIAHRKETKENQALYYQVNYELLKEVADKAKQEGVSQFLFMSSMSVYGMETGVITEKTVPHPKTAYGKSKLMAENYLHELETEAFRVTILRPPMVYGEDSPGNYTRLKKLIKISPVFPDALNKRSMIHVMYLCKRLEAYVNSGEKGIFFPQDKTYRSTKEIVLELSKKMNKKIYFSKILAIPINLFGNYFSVTRKLFGSLIYDKELRG